MEREEDIAPPKATQRKAGGWKAIIYILGTQSFEKLASMSLIANMTVYLQTNYNLSGIYLVNVVTIWSGSSNITTLAGAFVSDACLGRFLTLLFGTFASFLGMGTMALTAGIPHLRPPPCHAQPQCHQPQKWQLGFLFTGLGLLTIGAGGIRPCSIGFGADQFDTGTEKGQSQLESFFNWWYLFFTLSTLIALTVVVYIQTNISWMIGFAVPTACLAISLLIFLLGRRVYVYKKPQGSVFTDMAKVIVATFRKRHVRVGPNDEMSLYDPPLVVDGEGQDAKLKQSERFKWLKKAALIVDSNELDSQGLPKSNWSLCSVQQVEQLKCVVGIVPVWFTGLGCFLAMDQQNTFGILQAMQMNTSAGPNFNIPPAWMTISGMLSLSIWILLYERIYVTKISKNLKTVTRLTMQQRIRTGVVLSILCMVVAGIVEKARRDSALKNGTFASPMSMAMLLPQYVLSGLVEAFAAIAIMEYFTTQLPETMRSISGAIFFLSLSIASLVSSLIVNVIHGLTGRNGKSPWLGGKDLNKNRLEYYYYVIAALGVVNLFYFMFFSRHYVFSSDIIQAKVKSDLEKSESGRLGKVLEDEKKEVEMNLA